MNTFNIKKEWEFVDSEIHKPDKSNSLKRELLFIMHIILGNFVGEKEYKKKEFHKRVYVESKKFYSTM